MPPKKSKSRKSKKEVQDAESPNSECNNSGSTKPTNNKQSRRRAGDISTSTTNEPSSASATAATSIAEARHPTSLSETLPVATTAGTAAAPTMPPSGMKPRKAGYRVKFLKKLRVMLDRESQNDDATVHWSTGGNSFIITDHTQFEEEIIPKYFGNSIVFPSFLRKLQRWGFVRVSSKRSGRYEFSSRTFNRNASPTINIAANGGGASIPLPQQQQQVMAQPNQQPIMPVPAPDQLPKQANRIAIADLISNIQRQGSTQQPSTSSPQPGPNLNSILQNIIGSNQHQPIASQNSLPNQQPVPNHASQLNNVTGINHLQSFPQRQHPNNSTVNLINSALQSLAGGPTPPAQAAGQFPPPSAQSNAVHTLMSLMLPQSPPLNTASASSQSNNMEPILLLLLTLQRFVEEENQRRSQVDALHQGIIASIEHVIVGQNNVIAEAGGQRFGRAGEINMHLRNPTGMTVRVPNNKNTQLDQGGAPLPMAVDNNIQADPITAILQPAPRGDAAGQPEESARTQSNDPINGNEDVNDEGKSDEPLSPRNRRSSDSYEADDNNRDKRLRKRKKSPPQK